MAVNREKLVNWYNNSGFNTITVSLDVESEKPRRKFNYNPMLSEKQVDHRKSKKMRKPECQHDWKIIGDSLLRDEVVIFFKCTKCLVVKDELKSNCDTAQIKELNELNASLSHIKSIWGNESDENGVH